MYKLIALDMDGTLLREDKTISAYTKETIAKAKEQGVKIVLATGRPIEGVRQYLEELNLQNQGDYVISYNGALVQDTYTKEIINDVTLKGKDLKALYEVSKQLGINIHAFSKKGCVTPELTKYSILEGEINGIDVITIDYNEIDEEENIIKIMMVDEPEVLEKAIEAMPKELYDRYTVVRSAPYFLEFLNKAVNKGAGVKALAERLGIERESVICMGDAGNDYHMVEYAGLGVAMENAFPELKEIADYVTKSNNEDGVAHVIEKYVLKVTE